ncbi:MAG: uracil-DNA glycosylase [Gammaproteobacteria bacterium]
MDNATRLQYLEAMGIPVWVLRTPVCLHRAEEGEKISGIDPPSIVAYSDESTSIEEKWELLQAEVAQCRKCGGLCETRTQTVFGSGNKNADWMLIGEAPGQQEDLQGQPFVGAAGQLLTEMLRAIGLSRDEVYITNILKCRPPGNRDPKPDEAAICRDYLNRQIELIQPKIIMAIGRIAAQSLLATDEPLSKLRGKVHSFNQTPVVVVYHPAYLLRNLTDKKKAWQDLQLAMQTYRKITGNYARISGQD